MRWVEQIKRQGGDYVFSLKGTKATCMTMLKHSLLRLYRQQLLVLVMMAIMVALKRAQFVRQMIIAWLQKRHDWKSLQRIIAVTAKRETDNKVTEETRYFISSLDANDPKRLERVVRNRKQSSLGFGYCL